MGWYNETQHAPGAGAQVILPHKTNQAKEGRRQWWGHRKWQVLGRQAWEALVPFGGGVATGSPGWGTKALPGTGPGGTRGLGTKVVVGTSPGRRLGKASMHARPPPMVRQAHAHGVAGPTVACLGGELGREQEPIVMYKAMGFHWGQAPTVILNGHGSNYWGKGRSGKARIWAQWARECLGGRQGEGGRQGGRHKASTQLASEE